MNGTDMFDAEGHIDAMAPVLGVTITDTQRPGVAAFLRVAHSMAVQVASAPLEPDTIEFAPVFTPGMPRAHD